MSSWQTILCVDDDPDDRYFFSSALKNVAPQLHVVEAHNGREALAVLQKAKESLALPCMVVLDINMPYMNGRQTLELIQQDEVLKELKVIVFTSSENPGDRIYFDSKGVTLVVKPSDYRSFEPVIRGFIGNCLPQSSFE